MAVRLHAQQKRVRVTLRGGGKKTCNSDFRGIPSRHERRGRPMIHPNDGTNLSPCPRLSLSLALSHYEPVVKLQGSGV